MIGNKVKKVGAYRYKLRYYNKTNFLTNIPEISDIKINIPEEGDIEKWRDWNWQGFNAELVIIIALVYFNLRAEIILIYINLQVLLQFVFFFFF